MREVRDRRGLHFALAALQEISVRHAYVRGVRRGRRLLEPLLQSRRHVLQARVVRRDQGPLGLRSCRMDLRQRLRRTLRRDGRLRRLQARDMRRQRNPLALQPRGHALFAELARHLPRRRNMRLRSGQARIRLRKRPARGKVFLRWWLRVRRQYALFVRRREPRSRRRVPLVLSRSERLHRHGHLPLLCGPRLRRVQTVTYHGPSSAGLRTGNGSDDTRPTTTVDPSRNQRLRSLRKKPRTSTPPSAFGALSCFALSWRML